MAEKISIEIFRKKDAEEFTKALSDKDSRMRLGSGAAMTAAVAAADLARATAILACDAPEDERLAYLVRNTGILREYMPKLIDEDVKCHGPLRRAIKEGDPRTIEAAKQPAVAVCEEIVNMMGKALDFIEELAGCQNREAACYLSAAADTAMAAVQSAMGYILLLSGESTDETYRYVTRRENEITLEAFRAIHGRIREKITL